MGFLRSKKGTLISEYFSVYEDIAMFKKGRTVEVNLYNDELTLTSLKDVITLRYSQITDVYYGVQSSIVEKDKSPIGRAVVGGLLFGSAGAVVGAVSGSGKKEKTVDKLMFIIGYISSEGEEKFLQFEDTRLFKGRKLAATLKDKCGISSPKGEQHITL